MARQVVGEDALGLRTFDCPRCESRQVRQKGEEIGTCSMCGTPFWGRLEGSGIRVYPPRPRRQFQTVEWKRSGELD